MQMIADDCCEKAGCASLWDTLSTALLVTDKAGRLLTLNQAAEVLIGRSSRALTGVDIVDLLPEAEGALRKVALGGAAFTTVFSGVLLITMESGFRGSVRVRAVIKALNSERMPDLPEGSAYLLELTNVDEALTVEREEAAAGQMEANRQLLRNLAHEIKNPLGGIRGAAQLLEGALETEEDRECARIVIDEADRLQTLVERFLAPYRCSDAHDAVNVFEVLEYVKSLIALEFPTGIRFERDYDISIPPQTGDRARLTQIFLNLVRNAAEALTGETGTGGTITLRTRIARNVLGATGPLRMALAVDVEDNGPGIPADMQEKIFYPLVTGRAEGSGLGLSLAQTFVRQAGGTLTLESRPGKTVFRVLLPFELRDSQKTTNNGIEVHTR